jgi:hypothetical protein
MEGRGNRSALELSATGLSFGRSGQPFIILYKFYFLKYGICLSIFILYKYEGHAVSYHKFTKRVCHELLDCLGRLKVEHLPGSAAVHCGSAQVTVTAKQKLFFRPRGPPLEKTISLAPRKSDLFKE